MQYHRLTEIRPDERRATCAVCGPDAPLKYRRHRDQWACRLAASKRSPEALARRRAIAMKSLRWLRVPGMTEALFNSLMESQGGVCAICGGVNLDGTTRGGIALAVDHCHKTGRIRGLLCGRCNRALGLMEDDPELLLRAAQYVSTSVSA